MEESSRLISEEHALQLKGTAASPGYDMYADLQRHVVRETEGATETQDGDEDKEPTRTRKQSCPPEMGHRLSLWPDVPKASQFAVPGGFRREFVGVPAEDMDRLTGNIVRMGYRGGFQGRISDLMDDSELLLSLMAVGDNMGAEDAEMGGYALGVTRYGTGAPKNTHHQAANGTGAREALLSRQNSALDDEDAHGVSSSRAGTATTSRVAITFLKSMVGPFLLYMPKAFSIGGYAYSSAMLALVASISTYNMMLLLDCRDVTGVRSFGGIGKAALGTWGQSAVDASLFTSQFAYCTTYFIFVADNMSMVLQALIGVKVGVVTLMTIQLVAYIPLSWIRKIKTLSKAMLFANACVIIGLITVMGFALHKIATEGVSDGVELIKPNGVFLFTGSVVICFEGIGLVLPIRDMMAEPNKFKPLLTVCMIGLTLTFCSFGASGYLAYGNSIERFVIQSVAKDYTIPGSIAQLAYSSAVLLTYPLQLFPAVNVVNRHLMRFGLWKRSKTETEKMIKNLIRTAIVLCSFALAASCGKSFDNFVGVVGAFCACPLALIYPIIFHYQLIGTPSFVEKVGHSILLLGGSIGLVLCASVSLATW